MLKKYIGSMLGLAVGDALGAPVEFLQRDSFVSVDTYRNGGKFNVAIGEYTDDTAMALCLAQSLVEKNKLDQKDQLVKYVQWLETGYMSANNRSIGCGKTILMSLLRFMRLNCSECGNVRLKKGAGNGSLMRIAPVALFYAEDIKIAMNMAAKSSYTTHGLTICADACMVMTAFIVGGLKGKEKSELLDLKYANEILNIIGSSINEEIKTVIFGSYKIKKRHEIISSGYVVTTLEAALWAFYHTDTFEEGLLLVVNLGYDADTVGAVYGQLAGAYYGVDSIPKHLKDKLCRSELIEDIAKKIYDMKIVETFRIGV